MSELWAVKLSVYSKSFKGLNIHCILSTLNFHSQWCVLPLDCRMDGRCQIDVLITIALHILEKLLLNEEWAFSVGFITWNKVLGSPT